MGFIAGLVFGFGIGLGVVAALVYMMGRRSMARIKKVNNLSQLPHPMPFVDVCQPVVEGTGIPRYNA
jgi:hypothetical protein